MPPKNGTARLQTWVGGIVAAVTILGSGGALFYQVVSIAIQSNWHSAQLELVNSRLKTAEDAMVRLQADNAAMKRDLNEVETQFCASDIVRNLMHANDLRVQSLLWGKVFESSYPIANAYYPTICNRKVN